MDKSRIQAILENIKNVKIAVYGDFCLDAYWMMDPAGSEISVETGLKAEAVRRHYYSPGGAANIVANLAALNPKEIRVIGVIGNDLFGKELSTQLRALHADISNLIIQKESFDTYAFVKKYLDEEEPRIDFGVFNNRSEKTDKIIIDALDRTLQSSDALIFNQQVPGSISRPDFFEKANCLFDKYHHKPILLDSRHYNDRFRNVSFKTNEIEIARMNGIRLKPGSYVSLQDIRKFGKKYYSKWNKPLFVTCGERGMITFDEKGIHEIKGIRILKQVDTVGAGDTTISALAACIATGKDSHEAAEFANLAAAVTVQKLFTTGTATGREILEIGSNPDYIYNPDLAENPENANYLSGTRIEICERIILKQKREIKAAVFDHDGTISTLRNGWESVMEEFMISSITGSDADAVNEKLLAKIKARVREYIAKSTGLQTIQQMIVLKGMVKEFNFISPDRIRDEYEYKQGYLRLLMKNVNRRLEKIAVKSGSRYRYIIPGARDFLMALKSRGIRIYLASGTDQPDVKKEAQILGYSDIFDGGIYGSRDDIHKYSKKLVIQKILKESRIKGNEMIVFGDGPVEIGEVRKVNGLSVGLATDENKPGILNTKKRKRLIKAGAHLIMPDFREWEKLLKLISI